MSSTETNTLLKAEQERILYKSSRGSIGFSLTIAYLLAWYFHGETYGSPLLVAIWLAAMSTVSLFRLWIIHAAAQPRHNHRKAALHRLFITGTILAALCWGVATYILFPTTPTLQTIFITSIAGISAGAISTLCSSWISVSAFLCLTLLPLCCRLIFSGSANHVLLGILTSLFLAVCLRGARKLYLNIKENIHLHMQRAEAEKQIQYRERYDELTGLPNRKLLQELLDQDISRATRHNQTGALLFLDIDHFKTVNDSLGHSAGDQFLQKVASRIKETLRKEDVIARLGGDEFSILLPQLSMSPKISAQKAQVVATKITEVLSSPFHIRGQSVSLTQSIGISLYPEEGKTVEDLLKQADTAMNQAKLAGRNTVRFFLPDMQQAADARLQLYTEIKTAIENEEFSLHFQPQVKADGEIVGAEGLLRWFHPERGMVSPAQFIPIAEESALIVDIGSCVLRKLCASIKQWEAENLLPEDFSIAMNISAREFGERDFVARIIDTVREFDISPHHLGIELTEGSLISSVRDTVEKIEALRNHGIKFSVDDFGTGYSSLSYLKSLPLHTLKIDRSFVQDIQNPTDDVPLVEVIITLAHNLGLEIVAEGVEKAVELQYLAAKGCKIYQGYYFHKPMADKDFTSLLRQKATN